MFDLDLLVINLVKRFFDLIFPWPNSILYGFGIYAKFIISLFVFEQVFFIVYDYKTKKDKKKSSSKDCTIKDCPLFAKIESKLSKIEYLYQSYMNLK